MTLTEQAKALGITLSDVQCEIDCRDTVSELAQKTQFLTDRSDDELNDLKVSLTNA